MAKKITIGIKEPGKYWHFREVEDRLRTYQQIVGGHIEMCHAREDGILIFGNEEGKLLGLKPNIFLPRETIVGTVFAVRSDEKGEFISLTGEDIRSMCESRAEEKWPTE